MADISMCKGEGCKLKENCYRFKANANEFRQSYFSKPPNNTPTECEYYWKIKIK
jgi:hypothetical protein